MCVRVCVRASVCVCVCVRVCVSQEGEHMASAQAAAGAGSPSPGTPLMLLRADVGRLPFATGSVAALHAGAAIHCWPDPQV